MQSAAELPPYLGLLEPKVPIARCPRSTSSLGGKKVVGGLLEPTFLGCRGEGLALSPTTPLPNRRALSGPSSTVSLRGLHRSGSSPAGSFSLRLLARKRSRSLSRSSLQFPGLALKGGPGSFAPLSRSLCLARPEGRPCRLCIALPVSPLPGRPGRLCRYICLAPKGADICAPYRSAWLAPRGGHAGSLLTTSGSAPSKLGTGHLCSPCGVVTAICSPLTLFPHRGKRAHGGILRFLLAQRGTKSPFGNPFGGLKPSADPIIFKM